MNNYSISSLELRVLQAMYEGTSQGSLYCDALRYSVRAARGHYRQPQLNQTDLEVERALLFLEYMFHKMHTSMLRNVKRYSQLLLVQQHPGLLKVTKLVRFQGLVYNLHQYRHHFSQLEAVLQFREVGLNIPISDVPNRLLSVYITMQRLKQQFQTQSPLVLYQQSKARWYSYRNFKKWYDRSNLLEVLLYPLSYETSQVPSLRRIR